MKSVCCSQDVNVRENSLRFFFIGDILGEYVMFSPLPRNDPDYLSRTASECSVYVVYYVTLSNFLADKKC